LICAVVVFAPLLAAQDYPRYPVVGSTYLPLESWVYSAMDRLAGLGYVNSAFAAMRPWTRTECARLVEEAADRIRREANATSEMLQLYRALEGEFSAELDALSGGGSRAASLESVYSRLSIVSGTPLTDGYHFGQTITNDYGRPYGEGANAITGFSMRIGAGRFAAYIRAEHQRAPSLPPVSGEAREAIASVESTSSNSSAQAESASRGRLLEGYVSASIKNFQISFGKMSFWWGPGRGGAMILSNNADPIHAFRIDRVVPLKFPSILSWLGPVRAQLFVGRLAGHRFIALDRGTRVFGPESIDQPYIHGEKFSFKPTPNLEFGFSATTVFGGSGYPLTPRVFLRSYGINNAVPGAPNDPGDRRAGFDISYRVPGVRRWLTLYIDSMVEDEFSPIAYPRKSALNPGLYVPQIPGAPNLDLRVEGVTTDIPAYSGVGVQYFNTHYQSGYTNRGNIMGHWIGRQGQGIQASSTYWLSPQRKVQLGFRSASVSGDFLEGGTLKNFSLYADLWNRSGVAVSTLVQYERWKFPLLSSTARSNLVTSFQVMWQPGLGGR
jgi:hypothetical protein